MGESVKIATKTPEVKKENTLSQTHKLKPSQSMDSPIDRILFLQRTIGNQAVQRMMKSGDLQAKLRIGQPNDKYEQEADRVADLVMRMPEPDMQPKPNCAGGEASYGSEEVEELVQSKPIAGQITPLVQRQTASEKEREEGLRQTKLANGAQLQRQEEEPKEEEEEEPIQTKQVGGQTPRISPGLEMQVRSLRNGGQSLPRSECDFFEPRFGYDFSQVRIHTEAKAAEAADSIGAQAYTVGNHIVFGTQSYRPTTAFGRRRLAHELVHVVQQTGGAPVQKATRTLRQDLGSGMRSTITGVPVQPTSVQPMIQRDLAIRPPRPSATGRTLSAAKMKEAIDYNKKYLSNIPDSAGVIRMIRDVLGISPTPTVVDADFVNGVLDWQAMYRLTQDGKLGPRTARRLFREIGAEKVGQGKVKSGPRYSPQVPAVTVAGGNKSTSFRFTAEFESDPAKGIFPSCCEVRQFIRWNAAAVASWGGPTVPHAGFPATHPTDTWIEDRNVTNTLRYGHRSRFSPGIVGNRYLDLSGRRNQAYGHIYRGQDFPSGPATDAGQYRFLVKVIDVCRGGRTIGSQDVIRVNW